MYVPSHFANKNTDDLHRLIRQNALGTLVTEVDGTLEATHVPCVIDPGEGERGTLRFHLAAVNPICRVLDGTREILMIFVGPQSYISPDWYAAKQLVPTWNYAAVHAYGQPSRLTDSALCDLLDALSEVNESPLPKQAWTTDKVPADLYQKMRQAVRGYRLPIVRIQGKWKMNQNRGAADRSGVINNLRELATPTKQAVADVMERQEKT